MHKSDKQSEQEQQEEGVVYEVRALTDRWVEPMGSETLSTHSSAEAALDAKEHEPQVADDGTGRSTQGSYVPTAVVRVDADGDEAMTVPRPLEAESRTDGSGGGRW